MSLLYTISIAVHNRLEMTARCLQGLLAWCNPEETEILVWDNASSFDLADALDCTAAATGNFQVHHSPVNVGFGAAHNANLKAARGTYFVILNNDTEIHGDFLTPLRQAFLDDPQLGVAGLAGGCGSLNAEGMGIPISKAQGVLAALRKQLAAEYVEGACLMIPSWLARQEGLFSMEFRMLYCEDVDLSLRLRRKGWRIRLLDLPIEHQRSGTTSTVSRRLDLEGLHKVNHLILRRKWSGYFYQRNFQERILVAREGARGDVLLLTPVLRALREENAESRIDVLTSCPQVLENNPVVDCLGANVDQSNYDRVFDLNACYESKPKQHVIASYAEACGLNPRRMDWRLRVYPDKNARTMANQFAREMQQGTGRYAVIHPGTTAWPGRNWPAERFGSIARGLAERGWSIGLVGNHATPPLAELDGDGVPLRRLIGRPALELAAIIERADLFVGIDSFPLHLAQAALIPSVGIFGMIDPQYRLLPFPFIRAARQERLGCLGCHHEQPAPQIVGQCLRERELCMTELGEDLVWDQIEKALEEKLAYLEASKIRERIAHYIREGKGIDIGCGRDKITPDCIGYDDDPWPEVDQVGDARKLDFPDGSFDWVFSSHCLEDLADTEGALREWLRVLKPAGLLLLYVPHPELYKGVNLDHKHPGFRPQELERFLLSLGCGIVESFVDEGENRYSTCVVARYGGIL